MLELLQTPATNSCSGGTPGLSGPLFVKISVFVGLELFTCVLRASKRPELEGKHPREESCPLSVRSQPSPVRWGKDAALVRAG